MRSIASILCALTVFGAVASAAPVPPPPAATGTLVGVRTVSLVQPLTVELVNHSARPVKVTEVRTFGCSGQGHATIANGGVKIAPHGKVRQAIKIGAITSTLTVGNCPKDEKWDSTVDLDFVVL